MLAPFAGDFTNSTFGMVSVRIEDGALAMVLEATGAKLKLDPWNGEIFTAALVPEGRFVAVAANLGPKPLGFVQFQMDQAGKLNLLEFTIEDGQAYLFKRE